MIEKQKKHFIASLSLDTNVLKQNYIKLGEYHYDLRIPYISFGHYSGDKVLEKMGEVIRENIRASDLGFRIGGDEFAIILKNATKEQAKMVCEKIKADFSSFQFIFNDEVSFSVSISIGITQLSTAKEERLEGLLADVDQKLYKAKGMGKNQICI